MSSNEQNVMLIVVMGVSGCGKSTLAQALAESLDMSYLDADDLHPKSNVEKMSLGIPLTDVDRDPWLAIVRTRAEHECLEQLHLEGKKEHQRKGVVVACSALKRYYRNILRGIESPLSIPRHLEPSEPTVLPTYFVFIRGEKDTLLERMNTRQGHFMKSTMLDSQLSTLEDPEGEEGVVVVRLEDDTELQVENARRGIREAGGDA